ncbi:diguanylate cyclase [Celerinatantimonas yamalensis]|uniref:diguanylate cyclase n=1 Tax=Celerinatantimonas yamalensis TaxID=559956 RepID=A0ABW9G828_9GAMM
MNDVNSVLKQLEQVQQQLGRSDSASTGRSKSTSAVPDYQSVYQLINHMCLMCRGVDRALDNRLAELRRQLDKGIALTQLQPQIEQVSRLVNQHYRSHETNLLRLQSVIQYSGEQLGQVNGLPPKLRQQLKNFKQQPIPYSYQENLDRLTEILEFYHQAVANKPGGFTIKDSAPEHTPKRSLLDTQQHQRICDELQRMISELDFQTKTNEELNQIRSQLLDGIAPELIPSICQRVIQLMLDGLREERKVTQEYLVSLNADLRQMDKQFDLSVEAAKLIQQRYATQHKSLKRQVVNLGVEIKTVADLDHAKKLLQQRMVQLGLLFKDNEQLETEIGDLTNRLNDLESQLEQVRKQSEQQEQYVSTQKHQLFIDTLTQIYNRCALDERMELEYKRWRRYGYDLGIAIIDLDHFRTINQQFGYLAGDKALKVIARALQSSLRDTDFLARFGGEEFVILMPNINADDLLLPLDHIRDHVSSLPFRFKQQQVSITASIGATLFRDSDRLLDAFERADQALYEAKNKQPNLTNIIL